ncbi:hypothetical protein D3C87_2130100 [compost metagenome]
MEKVHGSLQLLALKSLMITEQGVRQRCRHNTALLIRHTVQPTDILDRGSKKAFHVLQRSE